MDTQLLLAIGGAVSCLAILGMISKIETIEKKIAENECYHGWCTHLWHG